MQLNTFWSSVRNRTNRRIFAIVFGLAFALCMPAAEPTISIQISTDKTHVIADSEITIDIAVTNISAHEINLPVDKSLKAELNGYTVSVISGPTSKTKIKKYQWEVTGRRAPRENVNDPDRPIIIISDSGPMPVKAGKTVRYHSILNDLYDVTVPGTYVVRVEKIDPTTNALVKSNTLPIVVAKPPTH